LYNLREHNLDCKNESIKMMTSKQNKTCIRITRSYGAKVSIIVTIDRSAASGFIAGFHCTQVAIIAAIEGTEIAAA
jgi:hypothetical protein